jgi:hypothetical protein
MESWSSFRSRSDTNNFQMFCLRHFEHSIIDASQVRWHGKYFCFVLFSCNRFSTDQSLQFPFLRGMSPSERGEQTLKVFSLFEPSRGTQSPDAWRFTCSFCLFACGARHASPDKLTTRQCLELIELTHRRSAIALGRRRARTKLEGLDECWRGKRPQVTSVELFP